MEQDLLKESMDKFSVDAVEDFQKEIIDPLRALADAQLADVVHDQCACLGHNDLNA